jgi:hypothetical protein
MKEIYTILISCARVQVILVLRPAVLPVAAVEDGVDGIALESLHDTLEQVTRQLWFPINRVLALQI